MLENILYYGILIVTIGGPILVAITFHEAAHGYVAWKLGDDTALRQGRVSFNPLKHIDPFGTILLPAILILIGSKFIFGYAKPVPVNFARLNNPKRDMVIVAGAGPATNLLLAFVSAILLRLCFGLLDTPAVEPNLLVGAVVQGLTFSVLINVVLAVFNMIPLPPLDGGRVAVGLLPYRLSLMLARLERWGMLILITTIFVIPILAAQLGYNFNPFAMILLPPVFKIIEILFWIVGLPSELLFGL